MTCQPKCQNAVAGSVGGGVATWVNRIQTSVGDFNAGWPANVSRDVLGNCRV